MMKEYDNLAGNVISAFFRDLLKYWYIIVICLVGFLGVSFVYLKLSAKTYKVGASVLLNLDAKPGGSTSQNDVLTGYNIVEREKNIQNEMFIFTSTPLIREVLQEMNLRTNYYLQEDKIPKELTFSLKDIYKSSPFQVIPSEEHIQPVNVLIYIKILDSEHFSISADYKEAILTNFLNNEVVSYSSPFRLGGTYRFGEKIENEYCSFKVLLNANFVSELYEGKDLFFEFNDYNLLTAQFKGNLSAEPSSLESTMLELNFKNSSVEKGTEFLNNLINKYISKNLQEKNFLANQTIGYIDDQLSSVSDSLGATERQLQTMRSNASVMNIDEKAGNIYQQLQGLENTRDETERTLNYLRQMNDYFKSSKDSTAFIAPSSMGLSDPVLNDMIQKLTSLYTEKQNIINNNQLRNPRLKTLNSSIANYKESIAENIRFNISTTSNELSNLNQKIGRLRSEFSSLPYTQQRLLGVERKFNLNESVYNSLLEKRIQAQIVRTSNLSDCEIIEPPRYMSVASPKKIIVLLGMGFLGLAFPIGFILGKRLLGDKFNDTDELKTLISVPFIGGIPHKNSTMSLNNVVLSYPKTAIAESFHTLRSNLIYYLLGKENGIILVTSSTPEEGKSFTAMNLATSFATTNNKTVLLEFDLRKPSKVYNELGTRALVGISSYLINRASLDEIIIKTEIPNLDIIQAGQIPPNPVELLSSKKNQDLFAELKDRYEYIIVDTPPYGLVSDSLILMKYVDIKLYVTRLGKIKKKTLLTNLDDIASKEIHNLYILANEDPSQKNGSYSTYAYAEKTQKKGILNIFSKSYS